MLAMSWLRSRRAATIRSRLNVILETRMIDIDERIGIPESAICLFAHPDDPDFICGGTLARWADGGCRITYVLMTDGRAGVQGLGDTPISDADLVAMRQREQREAAAIIGAHDVVFFDHRDGELIHTLELRRQLVREIRRARPQAAILFDPQRRVMPGYVQHPDHWTSGEAALAALFPLSGNRRTFVELADEGLTPHQVQDIYLVSAMSPNLRIDITDVIERKLRAMSCHRSQVGDPETLGDRMRGMSRQAAGASGMEYAEQFHFLRFGAR
ncbi:MAG TPA: hypothetical protein DEU95_07910, partial [Chloroflexi bacterium]|nr:hypothetical protein [Chloroflexota bacterium]